MVRGTARHVVGYLKDFLFDETQARAPVRSLVGRGEGAASAGPDHGAESNLLVLDEPTNDLDVETLDLLQETLAGYDGTVLLVSHDRDFLDRVATVTVALEGGGKAVVYAGGWSDMEAQRQAAGDGGVRGPGPRFEKAETGRTGEGARRFEARPVLHRDATGSPRCRTEIARLEAEIAKLAEFLSDPEVYATAPAKAEKATAALRASGKTRRGGGGMADAGGKAAG
jgi:ATP-binding cassette subfamily F protein uup